jgi:hypothetical protein
MADLKEDLKGAHLVLQELEAHLHHNFSGPITGRALLPALQRCRQRERVNRDLQRLKIWVSHKENRTVTV